MQNLRIKELAAPFLWSTGHYSELPVVSHQWGRMALMKSLL